jgi:hypothetical protein
LEFHKSARPVRTASAVQVRKPLYTDAIKRSTHVAAELDSLVTALGPSAPGDWFSNRDASLNRGLVSKAAKYLKQLWV